MYFLQFVSFFVLITVVISIQATISATEFPNCTFFTALWKRNSLHLSLTSPPKGTLCMQVAEWYIHEEDSTTFYIILRLKLCEEPHYHRYGDLSTSRPLFALCPLLLECPSDRIKDRISHLDEGKVIRVFRKTTEKLQVLYGCYSQNHYKVYRRICKFTGSALLPVPIDHAVTLLEVHASQTNYVAIASRDDPTSALILIQTPQNSKMVRFSQSGITTEVDVSSWVPLWGSDERFKAKHLCYYNHNGLAVGGLIWQDTLKELTFFQLFKLNDAAFPTASLFYEVDTASYADSDASLVSSCGLVQRLSFEGCKLIPKTEEGSAALAVEIDVSVHTPVLGHASGGGATWRHCGDGSYRAVISWQRHAGPDPIGGGGALEVSLFEKTEPSQEKMDSSVVGIEGSNWLNVHWSFASAVVSFSSVPSDLFKLSKRCRDQMTRWWELPSSFTTWCCVHLHLTYFDACWLYVAVLVLVLSSKALFFLLYHNN